MVQCNYVGVSQCCDVNDGFWFEVFNVGQYVVQYQMVFSIGIQYFNCLIGYGGQYVVWMICVFVWYVFIVCQYVDNVNWQLKFGDYMYYVVNCCCVVYVVFYFVYFFRWFDGDVVGVEGQVFIYQYDWVCVFGWIVFVFNY